MMDEKLALLMDYLVYSNSELVKVGKEYKSINELRSFVDLLIKTNDAAPKVESKIVKVKRISSHKLEELTKQGKNIIIG